MSTGKISFIQSIYPTGFYEEVTRDSSGIPGNSVVKNLPANPPASAGDTGSISESGRSLEEGNGSPL